MGCRRRAQEHPKDYREWHVYSYAFSDACPRVRDWRWRRRGGASGAPNNSVGAGGNSGATVVALFTLTDGVTGTVTLGSGGSGISGNNGATGGNSTFVYDGVSVVARGGTGGAEKTGGNDRWVVPPSTRTASTLPSVGGALVSIYEIYSEYGSVGLAVDNDYTQGGTGADGPYKGSGCGANIMNANFNVNGSSALANTGSGGGGAASTNSTNGVGGIGGSDIIVIYEF